MQEPTEKKKRSPPLVPGLGARLLELLPLDGSWMTTQQLVALTRDMIADGQANAFYVKKAKCPTSGCQIDRPHEERCGIGRRMLIASALKKSVKNGAVQLDSPRPRSGNTTRYRRVHAVPRQEIPTVRLKVEDIVVEQRVRQKLGDLAPLMESIRKYDLLHPVIVDAEHKLLAGQRRLAACRLLGWATIPVRVVIGADDLLAALEIERDENTCRLDLTPLETLAMFNQIMEFEKPAARARQREGGKEGGKRSGATRRGEACGNLPQASDPASGKAADRAAKVVGKSRRSIQKIAEIDRAATSDPEAYGDLRVRLESDEKVEPVRQELKRRQQAKAKVVPAEVVSPHCPTCTCRHPTHKETP